MTQNLWGGRFTAKPDETFSEFNRSFGFDIRLLEADVRASIAHANGLFGAGVLTEEETASVTGALRTLLNFSDATLLRSFFASLLYVFFREIDSRNSHWLPARG